MPMAANELSAQLRRMIRDLKDVPLIQGRAAYYDGNALVDNPEIKGTVRHELWELGWWDGAIEDDVGYTLGITFP